MLTLFEKLMFSSFNADFSQHACLFIVRSCTPAIYFTPPFIYRYFLMQASSCRYFLAQHYMPKYRLSVRRWYSGPSRHADDFRHFDKEFSYFWHYNTGHFLSILLPLTTLTPSPWIHASLMISPFLSHWLPHFLFITIDGHTVAPGILHWHYNIIFINIEDTMIYIRSSQGILLTIYQSIM